MKESVHAREPRTPLAIHEGSDPSSDEVRAQLELLLGSAALGRSERCQQFLKYVCDLTLRGDAAQINQYLIASEVFKKGPDYSTDEDSLVRRQAHLLRKKLDAYYSSEGKLDPIRIELPMGHYVPTFSRQVVETPLAEAIPAPVQLNTVAARALPFRFTLFAIAGGVCLLALGWVAGRRTSVSQEHPPLPVAVREIWGPWLQNPSGPTICLSNPMTAAVKHSPLPILLAGRLPVGPEQDKALRELFNLAPGGVLSLYPSRVNTKVGEAMGLALLAVFFTKASVPVHFTQTRLVSWDDLRTQDFVLMGHNEENPWLDPLLSKYPFRLGSSPEGRRNILIASPGKGEAPAYQVSRVEEQNGPTHEYALISLIPGLDSRRKLLLLNGLNTQATQIATELMTDLDRLQQLYARLKLAAPDHRGDWFFQVIIRTVVRDKLPTTGPEIIALRVL
ncbi:MAG TPA: hypothetical protein VNH18_14130 [Bryobacteraceae bacterium]|nr:hypothetical protein [Bryobacteraceae bacterium]